jgi:hypothetical protein
MPGVSGARFGGMAIPKVVGSKGHDKSPHVLGQWQVGRGRYSLPW